MAKTRSQTGNITIKEEEKEDCKTTLVLNGVNNTTKITKRKPSKSNNRRLLTQTVKVEEDTDTKSLLQSTSIHQKLPKGQKISQEKINQLIDAIVNANMSVKKAARTVKMGYMTAAHYYNQYKNDPEKKIPSPRNEFKLFTQEKVENLIRYIKKDKMTVPKASTKANMSYASGYKYYNRYLRDPDHNIPKVDFQQKYTQDQRNDFISYIINDKMNIKEASKKAKMNVNSGRRYYHKYFDDQSPDIATPSHIATNTNTQEQIRELISYIVDDKMSQAAASRKANMCPSTAIKHYRQYLRDHNMKSPVSKFAKSYTQEQVNEFIRYVVDDKMTLRAATRKLNMSPGTGQKYYHQYLKDNNLDHPTRKCTQDKIDQLIGSIIEDEMTCQEASEKVNITALTGRKYYLQYLKEHNLPVPVRKHITQDQIKQLIGYIVDDKMTVKAASKKANMSIASGHKHYSRYLNNQKRDVPV